MDSRFIIHFTALGIEDTGIEADNIYAVGKDVYIIIPAKTNGFISIYDMMGKEVVSSGINNTRNTFTLIQSGCYIVKVISNENVVTIKVIIE